MNANELADDLDNSNGFQYVAKLGLASQAATMLRQQQAEIENLEVALKNALLFIRNAQSNCNGFCGEYECKENQAECKRKAQEK